MSEAQKILDMIAAVDPSDTGTLDEIDARVWLYLGGGGRCGNLPYRTKYTRSRDALKSIRPEDFIFVATVSPKGTIWGSNQFGDFETPVAFATEELAELHAIIQAVEWSRNND